nr:MAG TPA: hypothetical protein [Caudoviricetes sp.]DAZ57483.1 MAG TPA: hypothetical protein [Caudoviricetes sp.]
MIHELHTESYLKKLYNISCKISTRKNPWCFFHAEK